MINRLRRAAARIGRVFDKEDALTLIGLALVGGGFSLWSAALALIVPGSILLWIFLPPRPPFVEAANRARRTP